MVLTRQRSTLVVDEMQKSRCRGTRRLDRSRLRHRRGVSDVVATIILLALTVTLFASIFAFVTTFPSPPHQNGNQFQASLVLSSNGQSATGINITHLTGPAVPSTGLIYLKSAVNPNVCPFTLSTTVGSGITGSNWNLGQTWSRSFTSICGSTTTDPLPDNITVYVVNGNTLLYSVILPGTQIVTPPAIVSTWVSPNPVPQGVPFVVHASVSGGVMPGSVYANLGAIPGLPASPVRMAPYSGGWVYNATSGASSPGSFTGFINATGLHGETTAQAVSFEVSSPTGALSVTITAAPSSGTAPLNVSFVTNQNGGTGPYTYGWNFGDGGTSTVANPYHVYSVAGTYIASLSVTDMKGNVASTSVTISVQAPTPSCSGQTITTSFGSVTACTLTANQQAVFELSLSQSTWNNWYYIDVFETDGSTSGPQPVFSMGTGMGGTPSLGNARQTASGPNAMIPINLNHWGSNTYGGWGTYWIVVTTGSGDSGGFCFEGVLSNSNSGSGPSCTATLAVPTGGGIGPILSPGAPTAPSLGSGSTTGVHSVYDGLMVTQPAAVRPV